MMRHWSFFDTATGIFSGRVFGATDESALLANTPEGQSAIEGQHDHLIRRVDISSGEVVDYQPPAPSTDHEWHSESRRWKLKPEIQARNTLRQAAQSTIDHQERAVQPRAQRELLLAIAKHLGIDAGRLEQVEQAIIVARRDL